MKIEYDHSINRHTIEGPRAAFQNLFLEGMPSSLLDVGCGTGTWLRAALDLGITDVLGIEGVEIPTDRLLIPPVCLRRLDLTAPIDVGRRFAAAMCLEVAEHLDERHADTLLDTLTRHSDYIFFAAACPGQPGQHHVNCQWPEYWQKMFNSRGFACDDAIRWRIWSDSRIEPWYRQNMFLARRKPAQAGTEPRIPPVIHPENVPYLESTARVAQIRLIEEGSMPATWYFAAAASGVWAKLRRHI
jgi:hypothetical protein